jgi:hypothetical protein
MVKGEPGTGLNDPSELIKNAASDARLPVPSAVYRILESREKAIGPDSVGEKGDPAI